MKKLLFPILALILALGLIASIATPAQAATLTLRPNGAGAYTGIPDTSGPPASGQSPASGAHWDKVDEVAADDATTYVYTGSNSQQKDAYALANHTSETGTINSVTVYFRFRRSTTGSSSAYCQPFLRLGASETTGTELSLDSTTWTTYSETLARPGGGTWSWSDIDSLQVCIGLRDPATGPYAQCTQVYVVVDYTPGDTTPPTVVSYSPVDNATGVVISTNLVLTFDENMAKGTGNILIKKTSDDSTVQTIDVNSGAVTISGVTVTINPPSDLGYSTGYYVTMASGVLTDTATPTPNAYAGISNKTTWNFTTEAAPNTPPVADPQTLSVNEDNNLTVTLTGSDADGDPLSYKISALPTNGNLYDGTGTGGTHITSVPYTVTDVTHKVTYQPNLNYNGSDSFKFKVNDGTVDSAEATISITVNPVNDDPVATDIPNQTIDEGGSFATINLDNYVSDVDNTDAQMTWSYTGNSALTVSIVSRVATISIPNPDWNGAETITFTATDPGALFNSDPATFTVTAVNDPPVVTDIPGQTIAEGAAFATISLDAYVSDVDNTDAEMAWTYSGNTELTVSIDGSRVATIGIPSADWNGAETITFTATDPGLLSDSDPATFTVTAVNDPPVAGNDDYNVQWNTTLTIGPLGVLLNDNDVDGDLLTVGTPRPVSGPTNGILTLNADGSFTYIPDAGVTGPDTFTYQAYDGALYSNNATVTLTVADYPVYNLNTGEGYTAIQPAIEDATPVLPGDTIIVAEETYLEVLFIDKSLTLQSEGEAAATIINGGGIPYPSGVVNINLTDAGEMVVFDGFKVTNGFAGILLTEVQNGSSVTIKNSIFDSCSYPILSYNPTVNNGTVNIEDNEISGGQVGIYFETVTGNSTINITGNTVFGNPTAGIGFEVVDGGSTVNITGNTVTSIAGYGGIYLEAGVDATNVSVNFNNIFGNSPTGVFNAGTGTLDAENNWWGSATGPTHPSNPGGTGDAVTNNVDYDPWLGAKLENVKTGKAPPGDYEFDALAEADTIVKKYGPGTPTITVARYSSNPGDAPAFFSPLGKYIDIHIDDDTNVDSIEIRLYYTDAEVAAAGLDESSLRLRWWDSATSSWVECSWSGVETTSDILHIPPYSGYMWAKITPAPTPPGTTPNLDDLTGTPFGGGGSAPAAGGGGGGGFIRPRVTGLLAAPVLELEPNGVIPVTCRLKTADSKLTLNIAKGTKLLDSAGKPLGLLSAATEPSPPAPPPGEVIILAYDFGANGASFKPAITLTLNYNPTKFPEGVAAEDLYIAYWDGAEWVPLETKIDTMEREASCQPGHFTIFALIAPVSAITPPAPAAFSASNLSIQPVEVQPQEAVTITLSVANTGGTEGSYSVALKINGAKEVEKSVTVAAGGSQSVSFSVTKEEAGSYSVAVDELAGSFTVAAAASSTSPEETKTPISWWIWVIVGVVVLGLFIFFLVRSRAY